MKKRFFSVFVVISVVLILIMNLSASAKERNLDVKVTTKKGGTHFSTKEALIRSDRYYVPLRNITEGLGLAVSWDGKVKGITIHQLNDMKLKARFDDSFWCIDDLPYYYLDKSLIIVNSKTYVPIRIILEPICQVQFIRNEQTDTIIAKENDMYYRTKILSEDSEIVINYKLYPLKTNFIKQNKEVFVPLREFVELINGKLEYHETSEYSSPEIKIIPSAINKDIALYPSKNQAILINNDSKEKKEFTLTNQMIYENGSYFICIADLLTILQAEKDWYLDSDVNTYFNFEF